MEVNRKAESGGKNCFFVFLAVLAVVLLQPGGEANGRTITVRADGSGDYSTIQSAIDAAKPGDEVVLKAGTYRGEGNHDLNFHGKAITVRSVNPDNNRCMCRTVIDAEGVGVIVRFINDEGPGSVFEGFTLGAGDTSKDIRGEPGFFEFSVKARPTTRRLRNKPTDIAPPARTTTELVLSDYICRGIPPAGRIWNGHDPFLQPVNTSNYHGSGDVDLDGEITADDLAMIQHIIDGNLPENIRADLNGDGYINSSDITLFNQALSGGILPAWWNQLTTRQQRNNWVDKIMALDKTDEHIYYSSFFVCHHFSYQTCIHGSFERDDFAVESTEYDGGQTVYNLPLHRASISAPTNHAINAILVGDDPLNFDDWHFLEPQNDTDVIPGEWNMRYDSSVWIGNRFNEMGDMVTYYVDANGWTLEGYSADLILNRPVPPAIEYDNREDLWHPVIVPNGSSGLLFFEKMRKDMTRTTDIHVTNASAADFDNAVALTNRFHFSRILDITTASDGSIHVLFESKSIVDQQNLFHGIYDFVGQTITDISQVAADLRLPAMARIEVTPAGEILVFWSEIYGYSGSYERGIHWTKSSGSGWDSPQLLTPDIMQKQTGDWMNRQFAWYEFDTEVMDDGRVILAYIEYDRNVLDMYLSQFIYDGTWTHTRIENTGWSDSAQGLDLCTSGDGTIHMAYWRADEPQICYEVGSEPREGRGDVYHKSFDGISWSEPILVDSTGKASCTRITAGTDARLYMVWERRVGERVLPFWCIYDDGWANPISLDVRPDANAWYPTVEEHADGNVLAAWSSRCDDLVTIETAELQYAELILYVDANATGTASGMSWYNAFNHLQDALSYVQQYGGVEIRVAAGTYRPDRNAADPLGTGDPNATFQLLNKLILKGGYAGVGRADPNARDVELYETILSGDLLGNDAVVTDACDLRDDSTRFDNASSVVTGSGTNSTAVINGFTITGGYAKEPPDYATSCGGGMLNYYGSPTVINCKFVGNYVCSYGAAMYSAAGDSTITDCIFVGNYAGNTAGDEGRGGAITNHSGKVHLERCTFSANEACTYGGALHIMSGDTNLVDCIFVDNVVYSQFGDAGAVYSILGKLSVFNCLFANNRAWKGGGGALEISYKCDAVLTNCTIVGNSAYYMNGGGGLHDYDDANTLEITNCIFWANSDMGGTDESAQIEATSEDLVINYSCVEGWTGAFGGTGNMGSDPQFAAGLLGDYYLSQLSAGQTIESPCVDAGSDLAGNLGMGIYTTRTDEAGDEGIVDMGYHYPVSSIAEANLGTDLDMDELWMYQSLPGQSNSDLTAGVLVTDDPMGNTTYSYAWEIVLPEDVSLAPTTAAGGGASDVSWTFAARGCDEPAGLSDSGQTFKVRVCITGNDYGNTGVAEAEFGIALLGDVNNDGVVELMDRVIVNGFWRAGSAGPFSLRDCDLNCDGVVELMDRIIANAVWRGGLGQDWVSTSCPLR